MELGLCMRVGLTLMETSGMFASNMKDITLADKLESVPIGHTINGSYHHLGNKASIPHIQ
jgi:hypothetical protein